jgi:hypothetical protein
MRDGGNCCSHVIGMRGEDMRLLAVVLVGLGCSVILILVAAVLWAVVVGDAPIPLSAEFVIGVIIPVVISVYKDKSFTFFVAHLHQLPILKLIMIGLGGVFAFWFVYLFINGI